jgi:hypothetical protein
MLKESESKIKYIKINYCIRLKNPIKNSINIKSRSTFCDLRNLIISENKDLILMSDDETTFISQLKTAIDENDSEIINKRKLYASQFYYEKLISKIENFISEN